MRVMFASLLVLAGCLPDCTPPTPPVRETVVGFCGVDPTSPNARAQAASLARDSGLRATLGPCRRPPADYSAAAPGVRYATPDEYLALLHINADAGLLTGIYDARLWSDDPQVRQQGVDFWSPWAAHLYAIDLGDEPDPNGPEWAVFAHRARIVEEHTGPALGTHAFVNHLPWVSAIDAAFSEDRPMAGSEYRFSFDDYTDPYTDPAVADSAAVLARAADGRTRELMCAVRVLPGDRPDRMMRHLRAAGCDAWLAFPGAQPINTDGFPDPSLVTADGQPTAVAARLRTGATS